MKAGDFPFSSARPVALTPLQWGVLMLAVAVSTAQLLHPLPGLQEGAGAWATALLFPVIPLWTLRALVGPHWTALFHRPNAREVRIALAVALANLAVTLVVGWLVSAWYGANPNPAADQLLQADTFQVALFFAQTVPQLLGEELLTVLPFLALLAWFSRGGQAPGRVAVLAAWGLSALPFALVHLPTYGGNVVQCLLVIGTARLVLMVAYLATRNVWASTLAHIVNDWLLFGAILVLSH